MRQVLIALFCLLTTLPAQAETRQHGNIIFTLPKDWSIGRLEDGIQTLLYDPADEICEYCYAYIATGTARSGTLTDHVTQTAPLFIDADDRERAQVMQPAQAMQIGPRAVAMTALRSGDDLVIVIGFDLPDSFETVAFEAYGGDEAEDIKVNLARLQDSILPMFEQLQFVSEGAAPLMPAPATGPLNGLWWGWYQSTGIGLDGMIRLDLDHRRLVFWTNGYFYDGTPPNGLAPLDPVALQTAGDPSFGTYRKIGRNVELVFVTGKRETIRYIDADTLQDDNRDLYRAETAADGTRLNGAVSSFFYSGFTPGAGIEGGVSSSSSTTFFPDGTYTGESFGGAFGNFVDGGGSLTGGFATSGNGDAEGGTYEIRNGVMIQYPDDGAAPSVSMVIRTNEGLLIDDQFLEATE